MTFDQETEQALFLQPQSTHEEWIDMALLPNAIAIIHV